MHASLRHVVAESSGESRGETWTRARVFPGIISARKVFFGDIPTCASLEPAEKGGANAGPGKEAESREIAGLGTALDGGYAAGTSADGFAQL